MGRGGHVAVFLFPRAPSLIRFIHVGFVVRDTKQPSMVDTMSAAEEGRIPYDAAKSTSHTQKTIHRKTYLCIACAASWSVKINKKAGQTLVSLFLFCIGTTVVAI